MELKLVTVKVTEEKKVKRYFIDAVNMTDVEVILTKELSKEFNITTHKTNDYSVIARSFPAEENPDDDDCLFFEVRFERENIDSKMEKELHLFICNDYTELFNYCKEQFKNESLTYVGSNRLDVYGNLRSEASEDEIDELLTKFK